MQTELIFRADACYEIGTGHVMRCLALANACRDAGLFTRFVGRIEDEILRKRINQSGHKFNELNSKNEMDWLDCIGQSNGWVILDGYKFTPHDHRIIRGKGRRLLVIDDMANLDSYHAEIILNQNFHAHENSYPFAFESTMLMNSQYALLRQEFIGRQPKVRSTQANRLLVTLGGSDPEGISLQVIKALAMIQDVHFEVCLIAGSSNPHFDRLVADAELVRIAGHSIEVLHYTDDMPRLMEWADFSVIAGGSTTLEVCYMGLPALVFTLADNQAAIAAAMQEIGVAESLGRPSTLGMNDLSTAIRRLAKDVLTRQKMTARGQALVDGLGARRVVKAIMER